MRAEPSRRSLNRRSLVARRVACVLLGALAIAACGSEPSYRYASSRQHGNYFKVPSSWRLENVTASENADRPEEMEAGVVSLWHTVFDSAAGEDGDAVPHVAGSAQIFALSAAYREQLSMSEVRSQAFLGVDPLFAPEELIGTKVRVVSYAPLHAGAGVSGSRVVANLNLSDDDVPQWVTRDVSLLFDLRNSRVFLLSLGCESECYLQNRTEIDRVASSWTVRS